MRNAYRKLAAECAPSTDHASEESPDAVEPALCLRVLDAALREDVHGLHSTGRLTSRQDGRWLTVTSGPRRADLPVRKDGFLCDLAARAPYVLEDGVPLTGLGELLGFLGAGCDPLDAPGFAAFAAECRAALETERLHARSRDDVYARLARHARTTGLAGSLDFDTVAAFRDHPAYPTGRCRVGLTSAELRSYAPEFQPTFDLRWAAVPRESLTMRGALPDRWPSPSAVGLPGAYDSTHVTLPVHPLTDPAAIEAAVPGTRYAPDAHLTVAPTLSMRTVALLDDPTLHLKVPLATSTLGLRNRRTITPGSLVDGDVGGRLLREVLDAEPRFRDRVLVADEHTYAHAGDALLGVLVRRYPAGLDDAHVVSVAALAAPAPTPAGAGSATVADLLADEYYGGDPVALHDAYLRLLLDWHTTLWLRYGIVLEAHQQNTSLVLDREPGSGATRLRLLLKDNDGPRLLAARVRERLPDADLAFDDTRIPVADGRPLADMFTTITLHLCAAAPLLALADTGRADRTQLMTLLRTRLAEAAERHPDSPDHPLLHERVLNAERLPVKLMVTAGTLLEKARSGALDVNKHYAWTGPNYLAGPDGA
ncbi:IucA/IucC family protein [Yinghuangia seranimata]|uniref:IucA/IucC family protein n=1 Tax=Yinghuangia seranimata TaxID=408067 RepID=UPI00248C717A|nr:IucA/IucC family protein [Yinghuangia seranimata]MDI2127199.1 IucA/IucC family protein [Yinghuangia seranimata]